MSSHFSWVKSRLKIHNFPGHIYKYIIQSAQTHVHAKAELAAAPAVESVEFEWQTNCAVSKQWSCRYEWIECEQKSIKLPISRISFKGSHYAHPEHVRRIFILNYK